MVGRTGIDLDGQVRELAPVREPALELGRRPRTIAHDRDDGPEMAGAQAPEMEVGDAVLAPRLDRAAYLGGELRVRLGIEQDLRGVADERVGPARNHDGAD